MKKIIPVIIFLNILFFASQAFAGWNPGELEVFNLPSQPILVIITNILSWLLLIFGIVAMIAFAISGILYLTASGDETQAGRAKKAMTYSIIGVIVGLSGFIILQAAMNMLSGSMFF